MLCGLKTLEPLSGTPGFLGFQARAKVAMAGISVKRPSEPFCLPGYLSIAKPQRGQAGAIR